MKLRVINTLPVPEIDTEAQYVIRLSGENLVSVIACLIDGLQDKLATEIALQAKADK
jgi:hypothetical protein